MKKLIIILCLLITSCGVSNMSYTNSHTQTIHAYFPNARIYQSKEYDFVYYVTDTLTCETYIVYISFWRKNTIESIEKIN